MCGTEDILNTKVSYNLKEYVWNRRYIKSEVSYNMKEYVQNRRQLNTDVSSNLADEPVERKMNI